jgi:hypothetical protein
MSGARQFAFIVLLAGALLAPADVKAQNRSTYVETLTGREAKRHLDNLRARRGDAFHRAQAVLKQRGWSDTGRITVWRTNREAKHSLESRAPGISLIQTFDESSTEGEVVAWEWEDGDYDTWEGTIYLHEYSTGTWMTVDAQFWLTANNEWIGASERNGQHGERVPRPVVQPPRWPVNGEIPGLTRNRTSRSALPRRASSQAWDVSMT